MRKASVSLSLSPSFLVAFFRRIMSTFLLGEEKRYKMDADKCPTTQIPRERMPKRSVLESFIRTALKKKGNSKERRSNKSREFIVFLFLLIDPSSATVHDPPTQREFHPVHFELDLAPLIETAQNVSTVIDLTQVKLTSKKVKIFPSLPLDVSLMHIFKEY